MGTPAHMDSSVEFHPQCDKKAPVDLCDRICNWGAQPLISMPRPLVRSSNPALSPSPNLSGYSESPRLYPNACSVFKKVHPAHMKSLKLTRILPCFCLSLHMHLAGICHGEILEICELLYKYYCCFC